MDISVAALSNLSQQNTASEISIRVAKKALDASKAEGDAAISLLQSAVKIQNQERSYAASPGGSLDVTA
jgi:ferric-dicitrate binding protein FerR (iron transport regulator)